MYNDKIIKPLDLILLMRIMDLFLLNMHHCAAFFLP